MSIQELQDRYFDWLVERVCGDIWFKQTRLSYRKLLAKLHCTPFRYSLPMDGNRAEDGIDLRYRFGRAEGVPDYAVCAMLDMEPCSVLEMMVALAWRCEESIMYDPEMGDQSGKWFWRMIKSLGLERMDDQQYDEELTEFILDRFLDRKYACNGEGGLFTLRQPSRDMRRLEIWAQLNWYLSEQTEGELV